MHGKAHLSSYTRHTINAKVFPITSKETVIFTFLKYAIRGMYEETSHGLSVMHSAVFSEKKDMHITDRALEVLSTDTRAIPKVEKGEIIEHTSILPVHVIKSVPKDWETYVSKHVIITSPLVIIDTTALESKAFLTVAFDRRLWEPSEIAKPGSEMYLAIQRDNEHRKLILQLKNDNLSKKNTFSKLFKIENLRLGTTLHRVEGIISHSAKGQYILRTSALQYDQTANTRPNVPATTGNIRIASINLQNFFNGDGQGYGFPTSRGAVSQKQFEIQLAKLVDGLAQTKADILVVMEMENDGYGPLSSIAQLTDALNQRNASNFPWKFVRLPQGPGNDATRVGILYCNRIISTIGDAVTLPDNSLSTGRYPLAQSFRSTSGIVFTVIAIHLKSKSCKHVGRRYYDRLNTPTYGCWNTERVKAAQKIHYWIHTDPTKSGSLKTLLIGDFNSYTQEDPMQWLRNHDWFDASHLNKNNSMPDYGYVYHGLIGNLDHVLVTPRVAPSVRNLWRWHINADENETRSYKKNSVPGPWRSSDHDMLLIDLSL